MANAIKYRLLNVAEVVSTFLCATMQIKCLNILLSIILQLNDLDKINFKIYVQINNLVIHILEIYTF